LLISSLYSLLTSLSVDVLISYSHPVSLTSSSSLDSCEFIRSRDVFDQVETESEYSSGFDECENNGSIFYQLPSKGPQKTLHDTTNHFVQQSNWSARFLYF
jgi:Ni,Fe-hydrogenase I small subunit